MKIVYLGRSSRRRTIPTPNGDGDIIELLENNWDDFGYKTSFQTTCRIKDKVFDLGFIKILVKDQHTTSEYLNQMRQDGWNGEFPLDNNHYISVPSEITFYEQLVSIVGLESAIKAAQYLRDASYLIHIKEDQEAYALIDSNGFNNSLQRERGEMKSYIDGWKIFANQSMVVMDLGFNFKDAFNNISKLELKFQPINPLPRDINVLIGANGVGKSQILHQVVKDWISDGKNQENSEIGFVEKPNLSQIVVVSYSPFERFPVDLKKTNLQDKDVYRYFGFRDRSISNDPKRMGQIKLTHEAPKRNAATSLLSCLADDQRYQELKGWSQKLKTAEKVLRSAFDFDYAAITVDNGIKANRFYTDIKGIKPLQVDLPTDTDTKRYIPISSSHISQLDANTLSKYIEAGDGVTFFRDEEPIELSSGQKLFSYIVINILGAIRKDSLILIDEPELFLHPTLEIQFIEMLKTILEKFNSKALLATHSLVTVREVPADCVHVLQRTEDGIVIKHPPFQTFGGDIQRISSYVFGDQSVSKPFERWIEKQLKDSDSEALIKALGKELNEELIIQIRAAGSKLW